MDANEPRRPVPQPTAVSQPYWDACKRRELLFQECRRCGHRFFPPEAACIRCLSPEVGWRASAGKGTVNTFTVIHREPSPGFPLPCVFAIVDLDEGYSMFSDIVGCDPATVRCDMAVEVVFEDLTEEIALPMFRPSEERA